MPRPEHEAIIRFGGEAPGRRAHSTERSDDHVGVRVPPPRIVSGQPGKEVFAGGIVKLTDFAMIFRKILAPPAVFEHH
jgi:hypothetical protein